MVIIRFIGGLGNQMFQYAMGRSMSIKNGTSTKADLTFLLDRSPHRHYYPYRDYELGMFKNVHLDFAATEEVPFLYRKHLSGNAVFWAEHLRKRLMPNPGREKADYVFDPAIFAMKEGYLEGFWQNLEYFKDIRDVLKEDFTLRDDISAVRPDLQEAMKASDSICVHVRRGRDFKAADLGVQKPEYFERGAASVAAGLKNPKIFVFSDDVAWCKQNLTFPHSTSFVEGTNQYSDHFLMRCCKHFVISGSTFGWWAAWLGGGADKKVVVPRPWDPYCAAGDEGLIPQDWTSMGPDTISKSA